MGRGYIAGKHGQKGKAFARAGRRTGGRRGELYATGPGARPQKSDSARTARPGARRGDRATKRRVLAGVCASGRAPTSPARETNAKINYDSGTQGTPQHTPMNI